MNARTLSQHYAQLTREERLRLMLAALASGDQAEVTSLWTSCPTMEGIAPDPNFARLILGVCAEVRDVILDWVELSHYAVRDGLATALADADDDTARAREAEVAWRGCSAAWKGVDAALSHFCAETDLTREQVLGPEPPPLIEEARACLHPQSCVDRGIESAILRRLRQAWAGAPDHRH